MWDTGRHYGRRAKSEARGLAASLPFSNHPKNLIPGAKPGQEYHLPRGKGRADRTDGRRVSNGGHSVYRRNHDDRNGRFVKELLVDAMHAGLFCGFNYHFWLSRAGGYCDVSAYSGAR